MRGMLKKLTRKQIIIIISSLVVVTGVIVASVVLLNRDIEEIKKCLVEFETNGGTSIESQEIECGNTIKEPSVKPEKVGFEFIGWYLDEIEFDFSKKINENIVLIANYNKTTDEELVTVTFDSVGGTEVKPIELVKGTTITEPVKPTKEGYSFEGWYLNEEIFDFSKEINENITLVARWKENKTNQSGNTGTSAKPNGGSNGSQGGSSGENNNPSNPGGNEEKPQPDPKPDEKEKYTYMGEAREELACRNSNYRIYQDYCYYYTSINSHYGCEGKVVNDVCYMFVSGKTTYSCNGGDKLIMDGKYCALKELEIISPYFDGTCPSNYEKNENGKCQRWIYNEDNKYLSTKHFECNKPGSILVDTERCGVQSKFQYIFDSCPSGNWVGTGNIYTGKNGYCYNLDSKTNPIKKYVCDNGYVNIDNKCYKKNY